MVTGNISTIMSDTVESENQQLTTGVAEVKILLKPLFLSATMIGLQAIQHRWVHNLLIMQNKNNLIHRGQQMPNILNILENIGWRKGFLILLNKNKDIYLILLVIHPCTRDKELGIRCGEMTRISFPIDLFGGSISTPAEIEIDLISTYILYPCSSKFHGLLDAL